MAYAHCHNCDWQQDDWWDEHYKPFDIGQLMELQGLLMTAVKEPSQRILDNHDQAWLKERFGVRHEVDVREFVAMELSHIVRKIRSMHFWTKEEFITNRVCPNCGSTKHLDVN